jgi:hypothetical protein
MPFLHGFSEFYRPLFETNLLEMCLNIGDQVGHFYARKFYYITVFFLKTIKCGFTACRLLCSISGFSSIWKI